MRRGRKTLDVDDVLERIGHAVERPAPRPAVISASAARAAVSARSGVNAMKAL